jgi:Ca-activated chloride channel family protein
MERLARLLLLAALPTCGQVVVGSGAPRPGTIRVDVNLVNVLCSVKDKSGAWAKGLTRDDFELRVDGRKIPVTHFAADTDSPLTVALLLDVSGSVATILDIEKDAARSFFDEVLRPGDQALLAGFSSTIPIWQDLTGDRARLQEALADSWSGRYLNAEARARGGTLLYDAVDLVASRKLHRLPGRKAMVMITDGQDNGSITKLDKAVQSAQQAEAVVFGIHYVPATTASSEGMGPLQRIAAPTGGQAFHVSPKLPLGEVFAEIADEMRHQYSLGFPPPATDNPGAFHKLEVKVLRPGMKVQARSGYYSEPR